MATEDQSENKNNQGNERSVNTGNDQTLYTLLEKGLRDIYDAEKQILDALPEMVQAADEEDLEEAFATHLEQTKKQVARLEKAFDRMGIDRSQAEKCAAMAGLIEEGRKVIREFPRSAVRDSALIIGAQKIEHYEIASYGSLCELADVLGEDRLGELLGRSLDEEEETDELLTEIAKDVNDHAARGLFEEEEEYR